MDVLMIVLTVIQVLCGLFLIAVALVFMVLTLVLCLI